MLFVLIIIIFTLLFIIAYFGDYESKEIEKGYELYDEIVNRR